MFSILFDPYNLLVDKRNHNQVEDEHTKKKAKKEKKEKKSKGDETVDQGDVTVGDTTEKKKSKKEKKEDVRWHFCIFVEVL